MIRLWEQDLFYHERDNPAMVGVGGQTPVEFRVAVDAKGKPQVRLDNTPSVGWRNLRKTCGHMHTIL